jgi:uncharacterized protein (DUF697 family)
MNDTTDTVSATDDDSGDQHNSDEVIGFTEAEIAAAIAGERRLKAENRIKSHVMASMTLGLVPLPVFDVAALVGNHLSMTRALCDIYEVDYSATRARAIVLSVLAGATPVLAVVGLSSGAKLIPGIGTLVGSGGVAVGAGATTYALGSVFSSHFEDGGDLLQPDVAALRARLRQELTRGKEFAERLKDQMKDQMKPKDGKADWRPWRKRGAEAAHAEQGPVGG